MFAKDALDEIEQWKRNAFTSQHQLDCRWIERYRKLCTYDSYWWLTWAGPFTQEEQAQWDQWFTLPLNETTKTQLGALMKASRERELEAAIAEQREPRLHYPAIAIADVRHRIAIQLALAEEIRQQEPNAIVRRFYQSAIEEELDYLRLIEASYEGNTEQFWKCNLRLFPLPTRENMAFAFTRIKHILRQGLENPETADISQQFAGVCAHPPSSFVGLDTRRRSTSGENPETVQRGHTTTYSVSTNRQTLLYHRSS